MGNYALIQPIKTNDLQRDMRLKKRTIFCHHVEKEVERSDVLEEARVQLELKLLVIIIF